MESVLISYPCIFIKIIFPIVNLKRNWNGVFSDLDHVIHHQCVLLLQWIPPKHSIQTVLIMNVQEVESRSIIQFQLGKSLSEAIKVATIPNTIDLCGWLDALNELPCFFSEPIWKLSIQMTVQWYSETPIITTYQQPLYKLTL